MAEKFFTTTNLIFWIWPKFMTPTNINFTPKRFFGLNFGQILKIRLVVVMVWSYLFGHLDLVKWITFLSSWMNKLLTYLLTYLLTICLLLRYPRWAHCLSICLASKCISNFVYFFQMPAHVQLFFTRSFWQLKPVKKLDHINK